MDAATGGGTTGGIISAVVIVLIIGGVIALVVWQLRKTSRANATAADGLFGERRMTAAEHRQAAERLAAQGGWAEAIRSGSAPSPATWRSGPSSTPLPGRTADELAAEAGRRCPRFAAELTAAARCSTT